MRKNCTQRAVGWRDEVLSLECTMIFKVKELVSPCRERNGEMEKLKNNVLRDEWEIKVTGRSKENAGDLKPKKRKSLRI